MLSGLTLQSEVWVELLESRTMAESVASVFVAKWILPAFFSELNDKSQLDELA
jgi:hypothetical protein